VKAFTRIVPAAAAVVAIAAFAAPAASASAAVKPAAHHDFDNSAVFALTDNTAGNAVIAYHRAADGTLTPAGSYPTGGLGGILPSSVVDHTASQGALTYDRAHGLLIAVNPGSNTISVFRVFGDQLVLTQVLSSGGDFPVSVAVHGNHALVLNALGGGSLSGYSIDDGRLTPAGGSYRALGLGTTATSTFPMTPGQVTFSPDGHHVLVTTKAGTNSVDVFAVGEDGQLSASPTVNSFPGAVPFDVVYNAAGDVLLAEAGPNAVVSLALSPSGVLSQLSVAATGQAATCWIVKDGRYVYVSNAGSASESGFALGSDASLTALGNTPTDAGTVDATVAPGGHFLYVQAGKAGIVDEFAVAGNGALTAIGSLPIPGGAGGEGIAAA
jgi:6-phosphogluconolactonase (cycloisomerase 2 family)